MVSLDKMIESYRPKIDKQCIRICLIVSIKVVVLDLHQFDDNRISKHIATVRESYELFRINFNFYPDRPSPKITKDAVTFNLSPSKNHYLNGALFDLRTMLGWGISRLERMLRSEFVKKGDQIILHVHDPYLLGLAGKLSKRFGDAPIIYDRHEYFEAWKNRLGFSIAGMYEKWYGKHVTEVIFVSRNYHDLPGVFAGKPVTIIPNYPPGQFSNKEAVERKVRDLGPDSTIDSVYFGSLNLSFDRDIELQFRVLRSLMESDPRVRFTVAGRMYDPQVQSLVDSMISEFGERMRYLGEIPYQDVIRLTQSSHLGFLFMRSDSPVWSESRPSSPNKVFENLLSGTIPVVKANLDDRAVIEKCSLIFGKDSTFEEIRDQVLQLIGDRERMKRMMMECYETSLEFTWEWVAGRYIECYERVLKEE